MLTGESLPVDKKENDFLTGASLNKFGTFKFTANKVGSETRLAGIIKIVDEAQGSKAPIQKIAVSVLVVSCPCALGLATPTAIMVGIGKGAQTGILIKKGEALERTYKINTMGLDKTGMITTGTPEVTDLIMLGKGKSLSDEKEIFRLAPWAKKI